MLKALLLIIAAGLAAKVSGEGMDVPLKSSKVVRKGRLSDFWHTQRTTKPEREYAPLSSSS